MVNPHHFNASASAVLNNYLSGKDWVGMAAYMNTVSWSMRRACTYMVCNNLLPQMVEEDFWNCCKELFRINSKMWLGSILAAIIIRYKAKNLDLSHSGFAEICQMAQKEPNGLAKDRMLRMLLPEFYAPETVKLLFSNFAIDNPHEIIKVLLETNSIPCYFVLFQQMKKLEGESDYLSCCCAVLLRKSEDRAFNFVSIAKTYFDLPKTLGNFALKISPMELSRLDSSYSDFLSIMTRI